MASWLRGKTWFRIHSWLGVIAGLLLFLVCWSGAWATITHEIDWLLNPLLRVDATEHRASWAAMFRSVQAAHPEGRIASVSAPLTPGFASEVLVELPDRKRLLRVYVNPHTADVLGATSFLNVQRFIRSYHIALFIGKVGVYAIEIAAIPLLVLMITPLVFYKRWWKRFFSMRIGRGWRAFWGELHKLMGLWSLWFALIIGVTGGWYLWEALRGDLVDGKYTWTGPVASAVRQLPSVASQPALPVEHLVSRAVAHRSDIEIRQVRPDWNGHFVVAGQSQHLLVDDYANRIHLNPGDASVIYDQRASDLPIYWRIAATADPLHYGTFGGLAIKLVWFVFGLALSGLCLTGAWLHSRRLAQQLGDRERARWPGTSAAIVAMLVLVAASVRGGWTEVKGYGPLVDGVQQWPEVHWPVTAFIAGWVIVTLFIIGWWSRTACRATLKG